MSDSKSYSTPSTTKIFVGGLSWDTTDAGFTSFFTRFGEIRDSIIMRDKNTGGSRGFGFVTFADPNSIDKVLEQELELDGRKIDCKLAVPKEQMSDTTPSGQRTKKLFVGGLSLKTTQEEFKTHWEQFGTVVNAVIMMDSQSRRSRGFGFVTFDSESVVESVLARTHVLNGKPVELKRAVPKEKISPVQQAPSGYGGGGGGGGGGYDQRGVYPDPYNLYGGYPNPYPTPSYGGYGYGYPRPESRPAPPRGYEPQQQQPQQQAYGTGYDNPYGYPPRAPPMSSPSRSTSRPPAPSPTPYAYDPYAQTDGSGYGYTASRATKVERTYHPYAR